MVQGLSLKVLLEIDGAAGDVHFTTRSDGHLASALLPIFLRAVDNSIDASEAHSWKASSPMVVTATGMVMLRSDTHFSKASSPID